MSQFSNQKGTTSEFWVIRAADTGERTTYGVDGDPNVVGPSSPNEGDFAIGDTALWQFIGGVWVRFLSAQPGGGSGRWTMFGGVTNVGAGSTSPILQGAPNVDAGIRVFRNGQIVGLTAVMTNARTQGTLEVQLLINGVAQTGVGETLFIDGTNPVTNAIDYTVGPLSPIAYGGSDILSAQVITSPNPGGFKPTSAGITVTMFVEDTF